MLTPIEIILYNDNDEVIATHARKRIPAYVLDMAIDLGASLEPLTDAEDKRPGNEKTAPLFDFIVELFGNKFSRDDLKKQSDLADCMNVYRAVVARANSLAADMAKANPPVPSSKKK